MKNRNALFAWIKRQVSYYYRVHINNSVNNVFCNKKGHRRITVSKKNKIHASSVEHNILNITKFLNKTSEHLIYSQ